MTIHHNMSLKRPYVTIYLHNDPKYAIIMYIFRHNVPVCPVYKTRASIREMGSIVTKVWHRIEDHGLIFELHGLIFELVLCHVEYVSYLSEVGSLHKL